MSYAELHASSAFSFLQAASSPEELAAEAARLELDAVALIDRDGVYGAPRFYRACREQGVRPLVGASISLKNGELPLLVASRTGYRNLCGLISEIKLTAEKGKGIFRLDQLSPYAEGLICLTGGRTGPLTRALRSDKAAATRQLEQLRDIFGPAGVYVELQRHLERRQEVDNQLLIELADRCRLPLLATNGVRCAGSDKRPLLDALTCIQHHTTLDEAGRLLCRNAEACLKPAHSMERLFADLPGALSNSIELADRLDFTLEDLGYRFPDYPVPAGENMQSYLQKLTVEGARQRYRPYHSRARRQIRHELAIIEKLELAGYFLIVWDIVQFCRREGILVQGRGSAANSAVCYSLGITAVDPVGMDLLFERFLSEERGEWPDIDLDLPSGERRERVIQYVYERYGRRGAAMTANVITYRARSAAREVGKVLGIESGTLDRLSKLLMTWGLTSLRDRDVLCRRFREAGLPLEAEKVRHFLHLWNEIQDLPRHLGQHSGGMVICRHRLDSIVPLERAQMQDRTVVQWDKDDCADLGIIKVDLLGLGMMSALQDVIHLLNADGHDLDLAHLPQDDAATYDMLQKADTVGVFQVESRAQMATLPRLKPTCFYDLVVEVAIIRPGPIVGKMVHPYLNRRSGREAVTYPHASLEPILKRTLGVPVFQEQLLKIAMVAAGFTGGEAEELRRAMGFKKPDAAMEKIETRLRRGLQNNDIVGEPAETIIRYITSFALYGFPESHAASFALLTYASTYIKAHYPAYFYTALLNNQPMGFYHPATLVKDAQHRGVRVRPVDVSSSDWLCRVDDDSTLRLGLRQVKGLRESTGERIVAGRRNSPYRSIDDLQRRVRLNRRESNRLAEIGALNALGTRRRAALWQVEKASRPAGSLYDCSDPVDRDPSPLQDMNAVERLQADYAGTGVTVGPHPMALKRRSLKGRGITPAAQLGKLVNGRRVRVAGVVIVRQRPVSAKGFFFMSLEDETGISNIIITPQVFEEHRPLLVSSPFLLIGGRLQIQEGVISIKADRFEELEGFELDVKAHNFG